MLVLKFIEFSSLLFQWHRHSFYLNSLQVDKIAAVRFFAFFFGLNIADFLHWEQLPILQCKTLICIFIKKRQTFNSAGVNCVNMPMPMHNTEQNSNIRHAFLLSTNFWENIISACVCFFSPLSLSFPLPFSIGSLFFHFESTFSVYFPRFHSRRLLPMPWLRCSTVIFQFKIRFWKALYCS